MRSPGRRSPAKLLLRVLVAAALLVAVTWNLDLAAAARRATALDRAWLAASFLVVFAAIGVSTWKWGLVLAARGRPLAAPRLLRHMFVGLFFNNVLPTTVGGDAVRAFEASRDTGEVPEAVGSVITDRLVAGGALGVTALLGLPFAGATPRLVGLVLLFLAVDLALVVAFLAPAVAERAAASILPRRLARARSAVDETIVAVRGALRSPGLLVRVAALSILFQLLVAAVNACLFHAMGAGVSFAACVVYTPMIFTVTMLPISLSGLGVREAAYAVFFAGAGVGRADAVTASLLFFLVVGLASLPGAPLFAFGRAGRGSVIPPA